MSRSTFAPTRACAVGPDPTSALAGAEPVPGLLLVVEVAGLRALLAADAVEEVVRLVALSPVAGAAAPVVGRFVHRGDEVLAVDLAACLGVRREPDLDAHVVVLRAPARLGLVVDAVRSLVAGAAPAPDRGEDRWSASGLAVARLRTPDGLEAALLDAGPLLERVRGLLDRGGEASR